MATCHWLALMPSISPVKDYEEFIKWILTFGILPIASSVFWSVISGALDLHNNVAKLLE